MADARKTGFCKEKEAAVFLTKNGYKIIETNFNTKFGEIDIIVKRKDYLVFVEVKYRKSSDTGAPQESVTFQKQQKIIKSAVIYLKRNPTKDNIRFDVIAINGSEITHIESAFTLPENKYYGI
ncbi:MAG: YraN family protein [Endomicrobia bacterium]|nr:YraN family protein [Endomicrobiia bacterium]MCL2506067.1 YraN family protein [Endomicrobiia bacterium]